MTIYLKQSTASQEILLGPFLSSTDGTTAKTGLTIANTDIKIWKAGGTTVGDKASGGATEISAGYYYATLDATDTDTLGSLIITVNVATALMLRLECAVLSANVYDNWFSTGNVSANVIAISGDSTAADNAESFFDGTGYAGTNNVIPTVTTCTTATNLTNLPAITADWLTATGVKADAVTKIQNGLATPTNITAGTITTVTNLTNAPTNGDLTATMKSSITTAVPTAAAISDAVWDEASTGHTDAGKAGAQMWTDIDAILEDTGTTIPGTITTIDDFLDTEVAAILADTNELQTDWVNGGRLDLLIDAIKAKTDLVALASVCTETRLAQLDEANMPTDLDNTYDDLGDVKTVVDAILVDTGTDIPATITTIDNFLDTEVAAILADTNELQTDLTNGGRLDLLIDSILEDTGTTLPATLTTIGTRVYPNYKITSPVFSVTGKMTSCTVTRYPTKADADAGTNGVAYAVTATYDGDDNLATYNEVATS